MKPFDTPTDWQPFKICESGRSAPKTRKITTTEGIGDRLRSAAFAELQALRAFRWAADTFEEAPEALKTAWRGLAEAEDRHYQWLLKRMEEIGEKIEDRPVSLQLWDSLVSRKDAKEFAVFMATAEDRGRAAGERFYREMKEVDPTSAKLFRQIAEEEVEHIRLATKFYPETREEISFEI